VVYTFLNFHIYLGKWSNLTNMFQLGWKHHLDDDWGAALKESSKGRWYSCIQGAQEVPSLELHTFTAQVVFLAWNAARPSNRNKEDVRLCFSIRLLFLYYHCNEGLGQRSWINGRYPNVLFVITIRANSFIELRTSATRSSSVLHIEVIAKNTELIRSMDGSSTPKLGSGLEAGCLYFFWFCSNNSRLTWCQSSFFAIPLHDATAGLPAGWTNARENSVDCKIFAETFPDAVIHKNKKEPPCVSESFDVPLMMYQSPKWCQENKLVVISLFSGIAGLELGLSKSKSQVWTMSFIIQGKWSSGLLFINDACECQLCHLQVQKNVALELL